MKRIFNYLTVAILAASCTVTGPGPDDAGDGRVTLTVNLDPAETKSLADNGSDKSLNDYQVLVFNHRNELEASTDLKSGALSVNLQVIPGTKRVWAVGNVGEKITPSSLATMSTPTIRLNDNRQANFLMSANDNATVTTSFTLSLPLKRIVSKVVIEKIVRDFTNEDYAAIPLTIKRIYMSNVVGDSDFGGENGGAVWYNRWGIVDDSQHQPEAVSTLIMADNINASLPNSGSYSTKHTFYVCPNATTTDAFGATIVDDEKVWTPRHTRLVVECDYNGNTCYYPITLPHSSDPNNPGTLQGNMVYKISQLTLKRPGSTDPDVPEDEVTSQVPYTFKLTIAAWEESTAYTETFE